MKRNGTGRLLAGLLALVMVLVLLPVGAAKADEGSLAVGGTAIDLSQNGSYCDGKVVFEIIDGKNVLTLNGYKLENYNSSGISAYGIDLTIVGSAEIGVTGAAASAIAVYGNLTLNGDFTLRAQSVTGATLDVHGYLTVEGGALDVENTGEGRNAIYVYDRMTVNGGTVHAKTNGTYAISAYSITLNNGETYLLGDAYASEVKIGVAEYPLWVGGVQVTSANQRDIFGDGTAKFEIIDGKNVLTLNDYKLENYIGVGISADWIDLTIVGSAEIGVTDAFAIYVNDGNLTLNGDFTLRANTQGNMTIAVSGYLTVEGGKLDVENTAEGRMSIFVIHGMTVNGGTVHAKANNERAIMSPTDIILNNGERFLLGDASASEVFIGKEYPLWVGNKRVNDLNKGDIFGDGTAKFEIIDGRNVLTLNDYKLENYIDVGISANGIDLTIVGSASIGVIGAVSSAISVYEGNLTLNGDFTLRAQCENGMALFLFGYLTVEGGALDVENTGEGSEAIYAHGAMTVNGGTVHAKANGTNAITAYSITLNNDETYLLGDANASEVMIGVGYTITFVNEDGTELQSGEVLLGKTPAYTGEEPTKPATAQYTYTFAGWKDENGIAYGLTDDLPAVTGEMTYTAIYTSTVNEYTITFVNEDGTVLQEELIAYGETPEYNGETPTKEKTLRYEYTFAGWDPEIVPVTGDATYTAVFTESLLHPIFICGDVDAMDAVVKEGDETLYRYDVTVTDLLDGAVEVNSAQIFMTYDHDKLELKRGEGAVDWTINDADELLSAAWASDSTTTLKNGDVVLTLYFAAKNVAPGETVAIGFAQNNLGLGSALSFAEEGETTELFAKTQDGSITFAMPDAVTIAGADVLSGDIYAIENGKLLYRYDLRMKDLPEAGLWINSAQIFVEFDHAILALARTEGAFDWTVTENGDKLMAVWASDEDVQINEDDVVLTLWFEKIGEAQEDGRVPIVFTTNLLGNTSAVSIAFFGTVTELETNTVDGSITFEEVVYGDANCDGVVTSADAALILRAIVGLSELSMRGALNADVDGDMEVTAADAALILRYVVGLVGSLPA